MTNLEIVTNCINELARINIPAGLIEQVGIPVYNVRQDLIGLANSMIEKENKKDENGKVVDMPIEVKEVPEETNQNGSEIE